MNIEKWPQKRIMMLPDNAFGQRFVLSCEVETAGNDPVWDISEISLPDKAMLWTVSVMWVYSNVTTAYVRLGMANKVPTSLQEMHEAVPLVQGLGAGPWRPRKLTGWQYNGQELYQIRKLIKPQGKKLVVEGNAWTDKTMAARVVIVVSSIPKEVPEWLISGRV